MKAVVIVGIEVASLFGDDGQPIVLEAEVLKDLISGSIIDEGFEDVSVHVTVVPEEEEEEEEDLHSANARRLFGEGCTPEERGIAKQLQFRNLYGGK